MTAYSAPREKESLDKELDKLLKNTYTSPELRQKIRDLALDYYNSGIAEGYKITRMTCYPAFYGEGQ
jgi:hypothetical protein